MWRGLLLDPFLSLFGRSGGRHSELQSVPAVWMHTCACVSLAWICCFLRQLQTTLSFFSAVTDFCSQKVSTVRVHPLASVVRSGVVQSSLKGFLWRFSLVHQSVEKTGAVHCAEISLLRLSSPAVFCFQSEHSSHHHCSCASRFHPFTHLTSPSGCLTFPSCSHPVCWFSRLFKAPFPSTPVRILLKV